MMAKDILLEIAMILHKWAYKLKSESETSYVRKKYGKFCVSCILLGLECRSNS